MDAHFSLAVWHFLTDNWLPISGVSVPAIGTAIFTHLRRTKSKSKEIGPYFTDKKLLSPPLTRPAYSDRMAYVLAEMSDLAYYQFEGRSGLLADTVDSALELNLGTSADIRAFLERFSTDLMSERRLSTKFLKEILDNSQFSLLEVINVAETQGIVCKRNAPNEPHYLVLAFRGTEKKVTDWLTDARCVPTVQGEAKVHTGFLEAFAKNTDAQGRSVKNLVEEILERPEAKDEAGNALPIFITGHSLGGALALLATKLVAPNITGACYTFGAPRIGNYEYFRFMKTPVYRIVNSSDVVPRVPPGAIMIVLIGLVKAISWITSFIPPLSPIFEKLEQFLDKLNGYRHFGDLRYLSDVGEGRFRDVRLLLNPPLIDRIVWMWRHLGNSFFVPINNHNMNIYRRKVEYIANHRNGAAID